MSIEGNKYSKMIVPILSPDPATNNDVSYFKYPIYLGGNRGRGQVYPDGSKSNNTVYNCEDSINDKWRAKNSCSFVEV